MKAAMKAVWKLFKKTFEEWNKDKAPRLGAALAYYTVFSLAPLLVVIIAITGLAFGTEAAQSSFLDQISEVMGPRVASAMQDMLENARKPSTGILATIIGVATLLLGASGVFGQLQDALNTVWGVEVKPGRGVMATIRARFLSFVAVLGTGFLLLVSLALSAWIAAAGKVLSGFLPGPEFVLQSVNFLVSFAMITVLFAMMFKFLPDVIVQWRDVWTGALLTATLFTIGKLLLALYLGKSDVATEYGAAGSLVLILVWVYYSAQILLFGAEFTAVYSNEYGSRVRPSKEAIPLSSASKAAQGLKGKPKASA
jgi:membrane protein